MPRIEQLAYSAISGSWQTAARLIEIDVVTAVQSCISRGRGIITGGALGVDFVATRYMLDHASVSSSLIVIIPAPLDVYAIHYNERASQGAITKHSASSLVNLLRDVADSEFGELKEMSGNVVDRRAYYARNSCVLAEASELLAFQLDDSPGTADTVDKARAAGIPIILRKYRTLISGGVARVA